MNLLDALWNVLSFFGPALGISVMASVLAKLLWRLQLKDASWTRLIVWAASSSAIVLGAGLMFYGQDGKMGTYVAMILACALALWWAAFGPRRR
jgi:hypothetical protein